MHLPSKELNLHAPFLALLLFRFSVKNAGSGVLLKESHLVLKLTLNLFKILEDLNNVYQVWQGI